MGVPSGWAGGAVTHPEFIGIYIIYFLDFLANRLGRFF
jgi:hypothetical protein